MSRNSLTNLLLLNSLVKAASWVKLTFRCVYAIIVSPCVNPHLKHLSLRGLRIRKEGERRIHFLDLMATSQHGTTSTQWHLHRKCKWWITITLKLSKTNERRWEALLCYGATLEGFIKMIIWHTLRYAYQCAKSKGHSLEDDMCTRFVYIP